MPKLFMLLVGCRPHGRYTEQHDIYFGIGESVKDVLPGIASFWPEAKGRLHIDAWREVNKVNSFTITVLETPNQKSLQQLYFINLGGYRKGEFDEAHYKLLQVAPDKNTAVKAAKQTAFFKHTGFTGALSHIDDVYGVDVDDIYNVADILPDAAKSRYRLAITEAGSDHAEDEIHLGYFKLAAVDKWGKQ